MNPDEIMHLLLIHQNRGSTQEQLRAFLLQAHFVMVRVMDRWCALFKGPLLVQRHRSGEALTPAERATVGDIVSV